MAPDGVTIIPYYEDLFRCSSIVEAVPGETIYTLDEYHQRVIHSETDAQGFLQHSHVFADGGDRSVVTDQTGNVYVANGDISIFYKQTYRNNRGARTPDILIDKRG